MKGIFKSTTIIGLTVVLISCAAAIPVANPPAPAPFLRPKLIIGITIDQMRYDYLLRYWDDFGEGGFRRLVDGGFLCRNMKYNYMPTYTGPGHASIFTGTTPCFHGIIQNDWYEPSTGLMIYCSSDSTVTGVGTSSKAGQMSPHYLTAGTLGDALNIFSNEASRVFGVAMKDRGAILPAGRSADAAYWFVGAEEGVWATSSWYMNELPEWVKTFNSSGKAAQYMQKDWTLLKDPAAYNESMSDNNAHETPFKGSIKPVFPYSLSALRSSNGNYDLLKATPYGNSMTLDFAKALIENENLGKGVASDMLCMSFSSTDYVGHQFGIHSMETQDTYLRLDEELAAFLDYLDQRYGKDNYLIFLSADHGGAPTPSYTSKLKMSSGYWKSEQLEYKLNQELSSRYGEGKWILNETNQNIFIDKNLARSRNIDLKTLRNEVLSICLTFPEVQMAFTWDDLSRYAAGNLVKEMIQNGFDPARSGDVIYTLKPEFIEYGPTGTTHGSPFTYDSHVPAIFYGAGVAKGGTDRACFIPDVAATVSALCRIPQPDACTGQPITEAIKK